MVPQGFVVLPALPLTPNGKIDRRALAALPPPGAAPGSTSGDGATPRSELERGIAETWRTALRVDRVPTDVSFFDLGGHSLLLAEVQVRLQEELQLDVSIVEMFQYPTVAGLAAHLERGRSAGDASDDQQRRRRSRNLTSGRRALRQRRGIRE
jgi:acyl carrier protein